VEQESAQISFIIPAYNCMSTLEEAVESIANGNIEDGDEVIVVNDASTDDTGMIVEHLRQRHHFVRRIDHAINKGGAAARNTAVENAKNKILFCLDADNVLNKNSVHQLKKFLLEHNADVAAFQDLWFFSDHKDAITHKWIFREGVTTMADYLSGHVVPGASGNYMFTKESWVRAGGYPEFAGALDAWGLGLRQVATGQKMMVMPDGGYYHRYGHESYWVRESAKGRMSLTALQIMIAFLDLMADQDVDYMMSAPGRYTWFEKLNERPIRIKGERQGRSGRVLDKRVHETTSSEGFLQRIRRRVSI